MAEQWSIQIAWEENLLTLEERAILGDDYADLSRKNPDQLAQVEEREQRLIEHWRN
jgi:hypothetical protein